MSKGPLFLLLLLLPLSLLPALEVYLNGELWKHYRQEDLASMLIPEDYENREMEGLIPLREILPLMKSWESLQIQIPAGEIRLEEELLNRRLDHSFLKENPDGQWQIHSGEDIYSAPSQIRLSGKADPVKSLTIWADPGLSRYRPLLEFWAASHRISIVYSEKEHLRDEILHRRMTGDTLPDFTLSFLPPDGRFRKENVLSYQLRSGILSEKQTEGTLNLILPRGERVHPELFFSLMAARFGYINSREALIKTAGFYNSLLGRGIIREKNGEYGKDEKTTRNFFFPAEDHGSQRGELSALPALPGWTETPVTRVLPVVLNGRSPAYREKALKAYLLHRGIQYSLFSAEERHIPAVSLPELLPESYDKLIMEKQRGYILYEANYPLWLKLQKDLPALLVGQASGTTYE